MLTSGVIMRILVQLIALEQHFSWVLFDHPPHSPGIVPSNYHLFIYLNCLRSRRFNSNEEFMEGVKMWLSSRRQTSLTQPKNILFPYMTSASVPAVAMLRSNLCMYVFLYI
jgi:hypothetical protein